MPEQNDNEKSVLTYLQNIPKFVISLPQITQPLQLNNYRLFFD
jgi:hypothetical protein